MCVIFRLFSSICLYIFQIGEICNDIKDSIFDKFRNGKIISTQQEAEDLRQQFSDLGEMFGNIVIQIYNLY